jgi:hypothetical protein
VAVLVGVAIEKEVWSLTLQILVIDLGSKVQKSLNTVAKQTKIGDLVNPVLDLDVERSGAVVAGFVKRHFQVFDQIVEYNSG